MPRPCSICSREDRESIDQALIAKEPYRHIAERFGTSVAALYRHQAGHMGAQTRPAVPGPEAGALGDAAQRIHTTAHQLQRQTVEVRSLHDPELLWRVHDLATLLVEVTGLLVTLTAAAEVPAH